ncbi:hypothetical protein HHK36_010166 [Tetracentron sinense]|uniref:Uncharacterized protein n=1 Tax=Tetracentron sinense TaxID=13715 RepID=A0A834ZH27_TETSI|nr:hypothetical protein HHK36_010166 [Tetracentron sinense]
MEVIQVLHMNGGNGETSYANNSLVQKEVISITKPITEEAILELYCTTLPKSLGIADLGCSSGPNTFLVVSDLMDAVDRKRRQLGHQSPEYRVFLNDLPGNDFNTIFRSLPGFYEKLREEKGDGFGPCFIAGLPGSFYGRLFPRQSLHFVHSSYSLQWLSQVPRGIENNKGNIYMAKTSPPSVLRAYFEQFQSDFSVFLGSRSEEIISGGRMVLTILGRKSDDPSSREGCYIWELLAMALNEMVSQGLIEEEKVDSFNIPQYTPSPMEVMYEIKKEGSFAVDRLEISEVNWSGGDSTLDNFTSGYSVANCMRAVAESLLVSHFGKAIIDKLFQRYREIIADRMSKEKTEFINVVVSMTRKG